MKIIVNDVAVKRDSGGVFSILNDLYITATEDKENEWFFILGSKLFEETDNVKVVVRNDLQTNYIKRVLFDFVSGARFINSMKPDIVISMQNTAVWRVNTKQYVYVHTPLPFRPDIRFSFFKSNERKLAFYQKIVGNVIKVNLRLSKNIYPIVQTYWMADQLIQRKLAKSENILVLPPSMDEIQTDQKQKVDDAAQQNDYIYPSTPLLYKHHDTAVNAFESSKLYKDGSRLFLTVTKEEYETLYGKITECENIMFEGRKSRQWVFDSLLNGATLVFPSQMETYGLPLMEAKKMNAKIIVNDLPVLREAIGKYDKVVFFKDKNELESIFVRLHQGKNVFGDNDVNKNYIYKELNPGFKSFIESELR